MRAAQSKQRRIRNPSDSALVCGGEHDFQLCLKRNEGYPGAADVSKASPELLALCGEKSIACLTDGAELGVKAAWSLLKRESAAASSLSFDWLRAAPHAVVANALLNVVLTANLTDAEAAANEVEELHICQASSATRPQSLFLRAAVRDLGKVQRRRVTWLSQMHCPLSLPRQTKCSAFKQCWSSKEPMI